jgi:hypothetical protein
MPEKLNNESIILTLAIIAAILYNSWPLGYVLDPNALHNSYVSSLEVTGKPYAWLFIFADILSGIAAVIIGFSIKKIKPQLRVSFIGYVAFGLATILEAVIPIASHCEESISACGISPRQILSPHDIASIVAAFSIFAILLSCKHQTRSNKIYKWVSITYWAWCITGLGLIVSVATDDLTTLAQALFLLACGLGLVIVPISLTKSKTIV